MYFLCFYSLIHRIVHLFWGQSEHLVEIADENLDSVLMCFQNKDLGELFAALQSLSTWLCRDGVDKLQRVGKLASSG